MTTEVAQVPSSDRFAADIEMLAGGAAQIAVTTNEERNAAVAFIREKIKPWQARVMDYFAPTKESAHKTWKGIVAQEKEVLTKLYAVERRVKDAILVFDREEEHKRRAEEERLQAEAEAKAKEERDRLLREAKKLKGEEKTEAVMQALAVTPEPVAAPAPVMRTAHDSTGTTWKARVVDVTIVPRAYLVPDQKALDAVARESKGQEKIAGVEFYPVENLRIR